MVSRSSSDGENGDEANGSDLEAVADRLSKYVERPSTDEEDHDEKGHDESDDDTSDGEESGRTTREESGRESLVVKSAVRERFEEMRVAGDFYDALNQRVIEIVEGAASRARANGRKTVQQRDL